MNTEPTVTPASVSEPSVSKDATSLASPAPSRAQRRAKRLLAIVALVAVVALIFSGLLWQKLANIQEQLARQSADAITNATEARVSAKQAQRVLDAAPG